MKMQVHSSAVAKKIAIAIQLITATFPACDIAIEEKPGLSVRVGAEPIGASVTRPLEYEIDRESAKVQQRLNEQEWTEVYW